MNITHAKLLDCTLRDGAYLIDKIFGDSTIHGIISGLVNARIDYIEIGFFQDDGFGDGKTVFKNSADAKRFVPKDKKGCLFTVLADFSRYSIENLDTCLADSVDAVRECFFKEERYEAIEACRKIKEKGYKLFIQPVDILGYSDTELIEFLNLINELEPYCFSIVDTFGSMYQEDLHRVFELINHNLISTSKIGFHSHNNMQLSNALSQEFIRMAVGKREIVVDGTISGMGRGAGNTPTELIAQYMVSHMGYNYDMDILLDIINEYIDNLRSRCTWGYSTPYFVAGCYSAHVNNVQYLMQKNSIRFKDIRFILNKVGVISRKRYEYALLEQTYMDYLSADIDDSIGMQKLHEYLSGKQVLLLVPGHSVVDEISKIHSYYDKVHPVIISVNFVHTELQSDLVYMSNVKRYNYWKNNRAFDKQNKIIVSNIKQDTQNELEIIVSFRKLIKCGWEHMDNSTIMLLRLLDFFDVKTIAIAGFDGYDYGVNNKVNYATIDLELSNVRNCPMKLNDEISSMLFDYIETRKQSTPISFITASRFEKCFQKL